MSAPLAPSSAQSGLTLAQYYANLLIIQYNNLPNASATMRALAGLAVIPQTSIETIIFSAQPSSGTFTLTFGSNTSAAINWNDSAAAIQTKLQAVSGLGSVTVAGSIIGQVLTVTMTGVVPPAQLFTVASNTTGTTISISASDVTLPFAAQNAFNMIPTQQTVSFSDIAVSGSFVISYQGTYTTLNWNTDPVSLQKAIQKIVGINNPVTVTGSILSMSFTVNFSVPSGVNLLTILSNTLQSAVPAAITVSVAGNTAVGAQLDILGEYAGVTRRGYSVTGSPITLNDTDFLSLIQLSVLKNNAGSSLATIQSLLAAFFPGQILVFDYQNMQMSYLVATSVGSTNLISLFITEGLLPKPMGVQLAVVIYAANIDLFFGFRTYTLNTANNTPFNSYVGYTTFWPWLSYANTIAH